MRTGDTNKMVMYCAADGVTPLYYQWERYQSSSNSWIRPSHRAVDITSPKLMYRLIKEEDEGIYHCVVSTDRNSAVVSDNVTLTVYGRFVLYTDTTVCFLMRDSAQEIQCMLRSRKLSVAYRILLFFAGPPSGSISKSTTSFEGEKVDLMCHATSDIDAPHPVQVDWYKDNQLMRPDGGRVLVYSKLNTSNEIVSVLLFDPVNHTDDGDYTCRSFNDPLSFTEVTTTLTVQC